MMDRLQQFERKTLAFEVKQAEMATEGQYAGEFTGYAAGILNIDATGDVILPGAFTDDLPRFLSDGVVCWQHDWMTPIGIPLEAREDGYGLLTRSRISRTSKGLDAMTLIRDGVVKTLSIGYQVLDYDVVDRAGLANTIAAYGLPIEKQMQILAKFDADGRDVVYLLRKLKLYEYSPVTVPANDKAIIMDAKQLTGLTFNDHSQAVLTAVEGLTTRIKEIDALRLSQGRKSNPAHGEMCMEMAGELEKACGRLRKMAAELGFGPKPKDGEEEENPTRPEIDYGSEAKAVYAEYLKLQAWI
jgi:HK97 family phage prohead protease